MTTAAQTPAEIDAQIAELDHLLGVQYGSLEQAQRTIADQATAPAHRQNAGRLTAALKAEAAAEQAIPPLQERLDPLRAEYRQRGWTRYFLVQNIGGHVHASMQCSSCRRGTRYAWLTGQSGMSAEDLIDLAGEDACTVCFAEAPVDRLRQPSRLTTPERVAAAAGRQERADKSAALTLKRSAARIAHPDGAPIRLGKWDRIETVHAAWGRAVGDRVTLASLSGHEGDDYVADRRASLQVLTEALAHKLGQTPEEIAAEILRKAQARYKREGFNRAPAW